MQIHDEVRHTAYKELVVEIWGMFQMQELDPMDVANEARFLMTHYAHMPTAEVKLAFETSLLPEGFEGAKHYGKYTREWVSLVMKAYIAWKKQKDYAHNLDKARAAAAVGDVYGPPPPDELEKMRKETVARAYGKFCEGKSPSVLPGPLYDILVGRGRITADAYKQHMARARDMAKAQAMVLQPETQRGGHAKPIGNELNKGWSAEWMAKDLVVRMYFQAFKDKKLSSGNDKESKVPALRG